MKSLVNRSRIYKILSVSVIFSVFIILSLACASAPEPAPEPKSTITLADVNAIVKNQEVTLLANNGLTADQLMEVIKLCIQTEELTNISIAEENAKLSYGVLRLNMNLSKIPVIVTFSCSISKNGTLKMRVRNVVEQSPETTQFAVTVYTKDFNAYCTSLKNAVLNKIENIGNTVIARAADFA